MVTFALGGTAAWYGCSKLFGLSENPDTSDAIWGGVSLFVSVILLAFAISNTFASIHSAYTGEYNEQLNNTVIKVVFSILFAAFFVICAIVFYNLLSVASTDSQSTSSGSGAASSSFSNAYGTPDTVCVVSGCNKKIASSGDTNCCTSHSNCCGECGKYIDGDAMYCMSCIKDAIK
ncbi:MAG: hypothetical protein IJO09_05445 [Oscillospiraceae bacterium]|nr:hypothetical protein [Oscillospiraceae bacterium]